MYFRYLLLSVLKPARSTEPSGELKTKISAFHKVHDVFVLGDLFGNIVSGTRWWTTNNIAQWWLHDAVSVLTPNWAKIPILCILNIFF